jgi:hypothetical protein
MKKTFLLALFAIFIKNEFIAQIQKPCSELFITEILTVNNLPLNFTNTKSQSVEIFNPSPFPVNLSTYSLVLTNTTTTLPIALSGTIGAKSTFVISSSQSYSVVIDKSNQVSKILDFTKYNTLKLIHNTLTIDVFGEASTAVLNAANMILFLANPTTYCSTNKIAIGSLQDVDLRRTSFMTNGDTSFCSSANLIGKWGMYAGNDFSNLGTYYGACNLKIGALPVIGYKFGATTIHEDSGFGTPIDNLDLQILGADTTNVVPQQQFTSGTATFNFEICFFSCSNPYSCGTSATASITNCTYAHTLNNDFIGNKTAMVTLTSPLGDFTPDNASNVHLISIIGDKMAGIQEYSLNNINVKIYPNPFNETLNIKADDAGIYNIYSIDGKLIKNDNYQANSQIDLSSLGQGFYFIHFKNQKGQSIEKLQKIN